MRKLILSFCLLFQLFFLQAEPSLDFASRLAELRELEDQLLEQSQALSIENLRLKSINSELNTLIILKNKEIQRLRISNVCIVISSVATVVLAAVAMTAINGE